MSISRSASQLASLLLIVAVLSACAALESKPPEQTDLLAPGQMPKWQLAAGYEESAPWTLQDGVYWGHGSLVGYGEVFSDFVLEVDFLFNGNGEGGIQIRSDRSKGRSWEIGYELDIDWHRGHEQGHIHFPVKPKPYRGNACFEPGVWHSVRIEAIGPRITVHLNGEQVLEFEDDEFPSGQICLQGEKNGVRYKNIKIRKLD